MPGGPDGLRASSSGDPASSDGPVDWRTLDLDALGALVALLADIESGAYQVAALEGPDDARNRELCDRHAHADIRFADAAVVAIVERLGEAKLATLDRRHLSVIRPRLRDAIELLPS